MNPNETISDEETNQLLKEAARRDQRTIGVNDIAAWYADLNIACIGYDDALAAVSRYYSIHWPKQPPGQRFRLTAPVLIELVHEIREQRHQVANYIYEPVPDETGYQFTARLRAEQRAVGNGCTPQYAVRELSSRQKPELETVLSGIADIRTLPREISGVLAERRIGVRSIRCPQCNAGPGAKCVTGGGRAMASPHPSRTEAWAVAVASCPECRAESESGCRAAGQPYAHGVHPGRLTAAQRLTSLVPEGTS
jgi:hypothetical protein